LFRVSCYALPAVTRIYVVNLAVDCSGVVYDEALGVLFLSYLSAP